MRSPRHAIALVALAILGIVTALQAAAAPFHGFEIRELFSNADGTVQYVVLREPAIAGDGQDRWSGSTLVATRGSVRTTFVFPADLPASLTAGRSVLVATPAFAAQAGIAPDYTMPERFLPTDGGELALDDVDVIALPALPSDGATALDRAGAPVRNAPTNFAGGSATLSPRQVRAVEYVNATLGHYFVSDLAADLVALDTGRIPGWTRTGLGFDVQPAPVLGSGATNPVCRILIPPPADSHFFSASPGECAESLARFPALFLETPAAFHVALPATAGPAAGACPAGTLPVYRIFNGRADANHRYTTDRALHDRLVAAGGIAEGYGPDGVAMCSPLPPLAVAPAALVLRFPLRAQASIEGGVPPYRAAADVPAAVVVTVEGSTLSLVAGLVFVDTTVRVTVTDATGQTATLALVVIEP